MFVEGKTVEKAASAGRLRSASLRETLVDKTVNWLCRHDTACWRGVPVTDSEVSRRLDGPGVAVFLHRDRRCFRLVARASSVLSWCSDALRDAFEGSNPDPLSALFVTSVSQNWDFYFIPVLPTDGDELLRVLENDTMLKHDSVWPYGINFRLHVTSFVELVQLRNSCRRHRWPMSRDADIDDGDVTQVQGRLCRRLRLGMNGIADDVVTGDNEFDVLQSLPDSPTSASAMLTFADIVAASTVKTWSDFPGRGRSKCQHPDDSSSSSDGSTVTATTVRTVVTKPVGVQQEDPVNCTGTATESPATRRQLASSTPRSASRPASSRVRQLTSAPTPRARSISQSRSTTNASNSVPAAGPRNVKTRLPHLNRQFQK